MCGKKKTNLSFNNKKIIFNLGGTSNLTVAIRKSIMTFTIRGLLILFEYYHHKEEF